MAMLHPAVTTSQPGSWPGRAPTLVFPSAMALDMETTALWELAKESADKVAVIAATLSAKESQDMSHKVWKLPLVKTLGELAGYLLRVSLVHDKFEDDTTAAQRAHRFLEGLEQLCKFKCPSRVIQSLNIPHQTRRGYPFLEALECWSADKEPSPLVDIIATSLKAFVLTDVEISGSGASTAQRLGSNVRLANKAKSHVRNYFAFLETFSSTRDEPRSNARTEQANLARRSAKDLDTPSDFPSHVHKTLFSILTRKYSQCCCTRTDTPTSASRHHEGRLKLRENIQITDQHVVFDTVLSRRPPDCSMPSVEWQHLQFQIPTKQANSRQVGFAVQDAPLGEPTEAHMGVHPAAAIKSASQFCQLLQRRLGPAKICLQAKGTKIFQMPDLIEVADDIAHEQSISLADILQRHELVAKKRLLLAYVLAKSFWQFYDSDWMSVRWTTETVQFFYERRGDDDDDEPGVLDESPYISLPTGTNTPSLLSAEYLPTECVVHRYPRLLALVVLLFNLGRRKRRRDTAQQLEGSQRQPGHETNDSARISNDFNDIRSALRGKSWPKLDVQEEVRETLRAVLSDCSNPRLFDEQPGDGSQRDRGLLTIEERRAIIYGRTVYPLKLLLQKLGWVDTLGNIQGQEGEDNSSVTDKPVGSAKRAAVFLNADSVAEKSCSSQQGAKAWLQRIQTSEVTSMLFAGFQANRSIRRLRIAVLDTGYDPETTFFRDRSRKRRIQGWKDMVTHDSTPARDEDGHGTHVLSLLMKVIPVADFYVARVARSAVELENSTNSVAEAIRWAAEEHEADIISMSFGYDHEIPVGGKMVISNAISDALRARDQKILFFAAAANEGGNQPEMFPASHPHVISIRGTDDKGWLQRFNPPRGYTGINCFMTLGQDVPGAGLSRDGGREVYKSGTSVSTPIAAGIAGMLLSYARLYRDDLREYRSHGGRDRAAELSTFSGMHGMLKKLSTEMMDGYYYLSAVGFLNLETHHARLGWIAL
ncbi:hypothetical protein QBC39DRAFT_383096 [Podospora conica]|nr:hypothetical protein QBC39DRAFT_383096 [Schizothecium conicum]